MFRRFNAIKSGAHGQRPFLTRRQLLDKILTEKLPKVNLSDKKYVAVELRLQMINMFYEMLPCPSDWDAPEYAQLVAEVGLTRVMKW